MEALIRLLMVVAVAVGSSVIPTPAPRSAPDGAITSMAVPPVVRQGRTGAPTLQEQGRNTDLQVSGLAVGAPPSALRVTGTASWYCSSTSACTHGYSPSDLVAAIDMNTGFHQGDVLRVTSGRNHVDVLVVDTCLCKGRRIIDLTSGAFQRLAPLSAGVIAVSITVVGGIDEPVTATAPTPTGPATDVMP